MAVFGYSRVSTKEQTTENQRHEIAQAGYQIDDAFWFADAGISGATTAGQRPQFKMLLDRIRPGETLVVSKLDRLGRDAQDVIGTIKDLGKRQVKVVVLQLGNLEVTSAAGKMVLTLLSAVAEMERDLLIERTKAGLERAKKEKKVLGRPAKTTPKERAEMIRLYAGGQGEAVSALARMFKISRASVLAVVKPKEDAAEPPQLSANNVPTKAHKRARKAAEKPTAAGKSDTQDMELRAALERKGQHRLPAV